MNEQVTISATEVSFKDFLFKNKRNKTILILAGVAIVVQFAIFKYLYPYASFIHGDSFSYINAAYKNLTINTYLIGYSKFLRLFSVFAKPDYVLIAFQYLFIQSSVLLLLFTIFYFYKPGNAMQIILLCFMVFNPLFLHLGNMVSSDGFFFALSCTWLILLLWIIHKPSTKIIVWQAIVLFIAFTVRYNAMIYPLIAGVAFGLSKLTLRKKIISLGLGLFFCLCFVGFTMYQYKMLTGYWQYSPFSGWQLANNAMYAYRYVESINRKEVPEKFSDLDRRVRKYFDSTKDATKFPTETIMASTFYMWSRRMPLMTYRDEIFFKDRDTAFSDELRKWASMGPMYKAYGFYIIKLYPWHFIRYFIWPNAQKYYAPPVEFLAVYNSGKIGVTAQTKAWFGYKSKNIKARTKTPTIKILDFYPILSGIINVLMLFGLIYYLLLQKRTNDTNFKNLIILMGTIWIINAGFTIFASSAALRFQTFPIILTITCTMLIIDWMIRLLTQLKSRENQTNVHELIYKQRTVPN